MPKKNRSKTSLTPKDNKHLKKNISFSSEPEMHELEMHLPALLSQSSIYSKQTGIIEINEPDLKFNQIFILPSITEEIKKELVKKLPLLAKRLLAQGSNNEIGKGTFSIVRLVMDSNGEFMALKEIQSSKELAHHFQQNLIKRGIVLFDTMHEIEAHDFLASTEAGDYVLLMTKAFIAKDDDKTQIFQLMPPAEGTGLNIKYKLDYFNQVEKEKIFFYICSKLLIALDELHQRKVAHRDIKLENILFTLSGFLGFSDLGAVSFFLNKLRMASALQDERYVAPYEKTQELTELELLQRQQRGDLWSLALTLLELWDPTLIDLFFENSLKKSKELIKLPMAGAVVGYYAEDEPLGSSWVVQDTEKPKIQKSKLEIYKDALEAVFASDSFKGLPSVYQKLFAAMLDLDSSASNMALTLETMFERTNFYPENQSALVLFQKFITIPDDKLDPYVFDCIKEKIKILLNSFSADKAFNIRFLNALNFYSPADFAINLLPLVEQLKFSNANPHQFFKNKNNSGELTKFIGLLEKMCNGEMAYGFLAHQLNSLEAFLRQGKEPIGFGAIEGKIGIF